MLLLGLTEDIDLTYKNVNWNAKNSKGEFTCRKTTCYTKSLVTKTVNAYQDLLGAGKITPYTPKSGDKDAIITAVANKIMLISQKNRIAAILYEYYWATHPSETKTDGSPAETTAPSIFNPLTIAIGLCAGIAAAVFSGKKKSRRRK